MLPIIKGGSFGKWTASLAIKVYDFLADVKKEDKMQILSKKEALVEEPLLNESVLKNGILYAEYRTDDARLTIELVKSAYAYQAVATNYCEATGFVYEGEKLMAVKCKDNLTNQAFNINARQVVSAGGPWVDKLRKKDASLKGKKIFHSKGVHLVFPFEKFPLKHTVYFDVSDGRMVFAIPRGQVTYVGTTDTTYKGTLDEVVTTQEDVQYVLKAISHAFPDVHLEASDIISNWAGLRPLIHEEGKSPSEMSRKDEIFQSKSGLISIAGGKLTGYRKMAERVVDLVVSELGGKFSKCKTKDILLTDDPFHSSEEVEHFIEQLTLKIKPLGLSPYHAWYLTTTYGKQTKVILEKFNSFSNDSEIALARAEVWYGVHHELVNSLEDFFLRRTGRVYFDIKNIPLVRKEVEADLQKYLNWDEDKLESEQKHLDELIFDATHFYQDEFENLKI